MPTEFYPEISIMIIAHRNEQLTAPEKKQWRKRQRVETGAQQEKDTCPITTGRGSTGEIILSPAGRGRCPHQGAQRPRERAAPPHRLKGAGGPPSVNGRLVVAAQNPASSPHRAQGWGHPDSKSQELGGEWQSAWHSAGTAPGRAHGRAQMQHQGNPLCEHTSQVL